MTGFSYKNLLLQIIHGSIIIITLVYIAKDPLTALIEDFEGLKMPVSILLLFVAFLIGVLIDFIADLLESIFVEKFINPPVYYLLTKERWFGIALAHKDYILNELCRIAEAFDEAEGKESRSAIDFRNKFKGEKDKKDKKVINYILQVAKNKAFRISSSSQKEQIDSFFILYIFSRNISLSLLFSAVALLIFCNYFIALGLLGMLVLTLASSYRYYLYYSRILLGSTIQV